MFYTDVQTENTEREQIYQEVSVTHRLTSMHHPETQRNIVIRKIITEWKESGDWTLFVNAPNPEDFDGLVLPDVVARFNNDDTLAIAVVETAFTIFSEDAFVRWNCFGVIAPVTFYIYVPKGYDKICRQILDHHNVSATLGTYGFDDYATAYLEPSLY